MGNIISIETLRAILADIKVPEFNFHIFEVEHRFYLQGRYMEADIVTGNMTDQHTRKWLISQFAVKSEIVQTAFKCYLTSLEHRARESFTYRGRRIFGPHFNVDALWELADGKDNLDYRGKE